LKRRLNARIEYAKFLQDTVKEMAKEVQNSRSGEMKKTAQDLDEFMNKVSYALHDIVFYIYKHYLYIMFVFIMLMEQVRTGA